MDTNLEKTSHGGLETRGELATNFPALSSHTYASVVHGGLAEAGPNRQYICLVPLCDATNWDDPATLDEHIKAAHSNIQEACDIARILASKSRIGHSVLNTHFTHNGSLQSDSGPVNRITPGPSLPTCPHPVCRGRTFTRAADLERHMKRHQNGPKEFGCSVPGCTKIGVDGFDRRDKLEDHLKTKKHAWYIGAV
ncbi:MAG: hypothetical protein MMC33_010744 [Icmadophila ericetorum]|nr:hypothetical protein [Icmadophila ericetorum]